MNATRHSVAVIGLGSMGMGAARSCIRDGLSTYGVDINSDALQSLSDAGARGVAQNCADFVIALDSVLLLVVNAEQSRRILFDNGLAEQLRPGTAVMVSATMSVEDAKDIAARLEEKRLVVLDAPVSGGAAKAEMGEMTVMASGSDEAFENTQTGAGSHCQQCLSNRNRNRHGRYR